MVRLMSFYIYFRMKSEKNRRFSKIYFRMTIVKFLIRLHLFLCKSKTQRNSKSISSTEWLTARLDGRQRGKQLITVLPCPCPLATPFVSSAYSPFRGDSILSCIPKVAGTSIQILSAGPDQTQKILVGVLP